MGTKAGLRPHYRKRRYGPPEPWQDNSHAPTVVSDVS